MKKVRVWKSAVLLLVATGFAGCSTVTPYSADIAKESSQFGVITKPDAAQIIKSQTSVSGETADYGSFIVDDEGFSFEKTTEEEKTEWKGNKPVTTKYTVTSSQNVSWKSIKEIVPYMEEYKAPFHQIRYRVRLDYDTISVKNSCRVKEQENIILNCKTYEKLVDVVAALKTLTDL
jgi:hypothetical protein